MDKIKYAFNLIKEKVMQPLYPVDIEILSFMIIDIYESSELQNDSAFNAEYCKCYALIIFGKDKEKYSTLQKCETVINSIASNDEKRELTLQVLVYAIGVHREQDPELSEKLLKRIIELY
jgi:hypothetical protein